MVETGGSGFCPPNYLHESVHLRGRCCGQISYILIILTCCLHTYYFCGFWGGHFVMFV